MAVTATSNSLRWPLQIVVLTLLAALAYMIARIVITLTNPESLWVSDSLKVSAPIVSVEKTRNFSFITDPFKTSSSEPVIAPVVLNEDVPETTLNLKMTGRIAGDNGSAILKTSDNKEAVYGIDDEVISDVILKAVNKDFVVLSVNGQLQRLTFERGEDIGLSRSKTTSQQKTALPNVAQTGGTKSGDFASMLQNVSLSRSMKNGKLQGYKVKSKRPGIDLTKFGFERGDIVTVFDGQDITKGNTNLLKLFQSASQKGQVDLTVLRNGQTRTIQLETK